MKSRPRALFSPNNRHFVVVLTVLAITAVIGIFFLVSSKAAPYSISREPETGVLSAGATAVDDSSASAGKTILFGNTPPAPGGTVTIAAAGDISNQAPNEDGLTAKLIVDRLSTISAVLPLGDLQYPDGVNYTTYNKTWGVFKSKTKPTPGNHDYKLDGGAGYYKYFAGVPKYYSYNLGSWHMISLNSEEPMTATSPQATWLKNDLAANNAKCTLAYMHSARYSSPGAGKHGDYPQVSTLWQLLYNANADVVLASHDHNFEQFEPMNPNGGIDKARGLPSFVVGGGGAKPDPVGGSRVGSLGGYSGNAVMFMDLRATDYSWKLISVNGVTQKSGTGVCR